MTKALQKSLKDVKVALSKARSIVLVPPEFPTLDNATATKLLADLFVNDLNKPTKILVPQNYELPDRIAEFVGYSSIPKDRAISKIDPLVYKITVPEVNENTQVEWKIEDDKFEIVLKPKEGQVDLSKAEFGTEGERYDLLITIGAQSEDMLNSAYQNSKGAADLMHPINIDNHGLNTNFGVLAVVGPETSTVTEIAYELYKTIGAKITKDNAALAMKSAIVSTDGLRRIASSKTLLRVEELERTAEDNISDMLRSHYLSLGPKGLTLREEMLKRIKFENNGSILLSTLPSKVMSELGIESSVLDGVEQLPFNICKETKVAALAYESAKDAWKVLVLANDQEVNLHKWARALGGTGIASIAVADVKGDEGTAVQTVTKTLKAEVFEDQTTQITQPPPTISNEKKDEELEKEEPKVITPPPPTDSPFETVSDEELKEFTAQDASGATPGTNTSAKTPFTKAEEFGQ